MRRGRMLRAGLLSVAAAAATLATADRLHLEGGGLIDTGRWWVEGERLMYETAVGIVGLPRSMVVRIDRTAAGPPAPAAAQRPLVRPAVKVKPLPLPSSGTAVPRQLALLLDEARVHFDRGEWEEAASVYERALAAADPELQLPRIGYALCMIALGRDARARSIVLQGLAHEPRQSALLELLGDLDDRQELVEDALRSWNDAFATAPSDRLREKILRAERELEAGRKYALATSAHFNMRYDGAVDAALAREVTEYLERQYWVLADAFRHAPAQPITVLLYPSREFRDVTQTPETIGGLYDGKIRVPLGGLRRLDPAAQAVLAHELTHAVIHSKSLGHCPRWLHEGLAQRSEGRRLSRADRQGIVERLAGGEPAAWESGGFSYPIALSLTAFLESRHGLDGLVRLLDHLAAGAELDAALEQVYSASYARLCRDWAEALAREEPAP